MARQFVLVRVLNMRGVNLNLFEFDYDQEWSAFFLNADEVVYGRYAGRKADPGDDFLTLPGLRHALEAALARHRQGGTAPPAVATKTVEQYPAAQRLRPRACIHCHQAYDYQHEEQENAGTFRKESMWVYPWPENLGLTLNPDRGHEIRAVQAGSPAARLGLQPGDLLARVGGRDVVSFADITWALHRAGEVRSLELVWRRGQQTLNGTLKLPADWRVTDLSWRASSNLLGPDPTLWGEDLKADEKRALGLQPGQLAFRQGQFLSVTARQAGLQLNDVIVGAEGKALELTARQFLVWIRLNYRVGERINFDLIRDGQRRTIAVTLPRRAQD